MASKLAHFRARIRDVSVSEAEFEIQKSQRDALIAFTERLGARVREDWNEPEGARFIGTIEGRTITLFPRFDSHFAMYFTVAHLYGHLVQLTRKTPAMEATFALTFRLGEPMLARDVQRLYDFELEAAAIGRHLIGELGEVSLELDRQYSRMFLADFHYLVEAIERGNGGPVLFQSFLRKQPVPHVLIASDARPLVDVSVLETEARSNTTVL